MVTIKFKIVLYSQNNCSVIPIAYAFKVFTGLWTPLAHQTAAGEGRLIFGCIKNLGSFPAVDRLGQLGFLPEPIFHILLVPTGVSTLPSHCGSAQPLGPPPPRPVGRQQDGRPDACLPGSLQRRLRIRLLAPALGTQTGSRRQGPYLRPPQVFPRPGPHIHRHRTWAGVSP